MTDKKLGESLEQLKAIMDKTNGAFSKTLYRCITEYEPQELDGMVFLGEQGKHPKMWMPTEDYEDFVKWIAEQQKEDE